MRGGLARRMCSDTENFFSPPSLVVVVIGKKLLPQTPQKTVPSSSSRPSTLYPLPGQRTNFGFVMDSRRSIIKSRVVGKRRNVSLGFISLREISTFTLRRGAGKMFTQTPV